MAWVKRVGGGALHTGINSALGVGAWLSFHGDRFSNWENMVKPAGIVGTSFTPPSDPGLFRSIRGNEPSLRSTAPSIWRWTQVKLLMPDGSCHCCCAWWH